MKEESKSSKYQFKIKLKNEKIIVRMKGTKNLFVKDIHIQR